MDETPTPTPVKDPVCGMDVTPEVAEAQGLTSHHDGKAWYFCSRGCKLDFDDDPAKFLDPGYQPSM
jgi:Cu+-exporting ATPase